MSEVVITCEGVGKVFRIPRADQRTLRGRILHPGSGTRFEEFRAIKSVDVEIRKGEFFGVVGRNGSGKSTLLKILAGIYKLDEGSIEIDGSIAPFIELGVGFNEDLSARDNVFINGAILGMSRKQVADRFDAIVEFAELHQFMEMKLRNFSSGMLMRLAFAIAVQSGAEILLIDEVLAVGDGRFQRKCHEVFRERKRRGETVVFVSHDMNAIEAFCDRVLLLENGVQIALGPPAVVVPKYHELNRPIEDGIDGAPVTEGSEQHPVVIRRFELLDEQGEPMEAWPADSTLGLEVDLDSPTRLEQAMVRVLVTNEGGGLVGALTAQLNTLEPDAPRTVRIDAENILGAGTYGLEIEVHAVVDGRPQLVAAPRRRDIDVDADRSVGVARIPHTSTVTDTVDHELAHAD